MPKGSRCPSCGQLTFQKKNAISECSNCNAAGWIGEPTTPGGGSGSECKRCGERRVRKIYEGKGLKVYHCFSCKATYLT